MARGQMEGRGGTGNQLGGVKYLATPGLRCAVPTVEGV